MAGDRARWKRITELFHAALERPPEERDAFIAAACGGDESLAAEVRKLLASHARASDARFIEDPAVANDPDLVETASGAGTSLVGETVDDYHIEREIARGGMGVVYLARDTRLGRAVALKALPPSLASDPDRRERLHREAQAAAKLEHPAVARVYAFKEAKGVAFIITEYIDGHSLREDIGRGPLATPDLLTTARALASGLAAAHAKGIVHRDLKPENVMRARDGSVKILDFGVARLLNVDSRGPTSPQLTVDGMIVGTPGYMAPEQLAGRPVDARADVYAFGVLLHELATGRLPGSGAAGKGLLTPGLERVIRKCLAPNPEDRFQNGAELSGALQSIPGSDPAPSAPARPPLWWWQFHQLAIASFHAALLVVVWIGRGWLDRPWRSIALYTAIVAVTCGVTMRLNLWFASRVHPSTLVAQWTRLARAIAAADVVYAAVLLVLAAAGVGAHDELAAVLLGGAIVSLLSLVLIEPATSRAAFARLPRGRGTPRGPRDKAPTPRRGRPLSR